MRTRMVRDHVKRIDRPLILFLVFLGYVGWAAGNFYETYVLSEVPTEDNGVWTDQPLVTACLVPN